MRSHDEMVQMFWPYIPEDAIEEVVKTLRSRFVGQGPKVDEFEKQFSKFFNVPYVCALNSGSSALETAMDLIGIKEGDEVITTPLTCTATNIFLLHRKAKIVWADIGADLNINPEDVVRKITSKTKAIIQVHLGGIKAGVPEHLNAYYKGKPIPVISDAAQALGIFTGNYTCCSFQAIKHLTTGDGGMITLNTANSERDRNEAQKLRWFGIDRKKKARNGWQAYTQRQMTFDIVRPGFKRQMTDIDASLGLAGLRHHNEVMTHLKKIFNIYKEGLEGVSGVEVIDSEENKHWLATLLVERRDDFAKMLFENFIDTNLVQVRNDLFTCFGKTRQDLPVMNSLEEKYICIPLNMTVTEDEAQHIVDVIKKGW